MRDLTFRGIALDFLARISSTKFLVASGIILYFIYMDYKGDPADIETIIGTISATLGYTAGNLINKSVLK